MGFYDAIRVGASGAADTAFTVDRSLRFNSGDNPYLTRTPSSSSNKKTMTFSFWFKRAEDDGFRTIFRGIGNSSNRHGLDTVSGGQIRFWGNYNGSVAMTVQPTQVFRDFSAWYHFVVALDTTQATASNRVKMYVNGNQITDFATASYPSQNFEFGFNDQNADTEINGVKGYIAEFHEIDGTTLTPSSFAETNAVTGQWNPKEYTGSYGTNGFYLNFSDNSGTTATTLGKDSSGNGNNFTPNNFSVSAGEGNDSVEDTPTNNWATLNPLEPNSNVTFSEGNLKVVRSNAGFIASSNFVVTSGKWYMEMKYVSGTSNHQLNVGFTNPDRSYSRFVRGGDGELTPNTGNVSVTFADPDILMLALDVDNGKWYIGKNGSYMLSGDPVNGTGFVQSGLSSSDGFMFVASNATSAGGQTISANFGQQGFSYTPPTDFKAFNSANLPDPTILLPNKHFDTVIYSGDGNSTRSITGVQFQPDWLWLKIRSASYNHKLYDAVRGAGSLKALCSSTTGAEGSDLDNSTYGFVNSFDANGFSVTKGSSSTSFTNGGSATYVAWNWNAGDTDGKTYTVTVVSDSGNKYRFDGFGTSAVTLDLAEGGTYIFDQSHSSNATHPLRFYTAADKTGGEYTTGVTTSGTAGSSGATVTITIAASAPTLFYQCSSHAGMGGQINTNSTLGSSNFDGSTQSVVKVNASAGFSIVSYTGQQNASDTIGHGLGVKPQVVITKSRNATYTYTQWYVYHHKLSTNHFLFLNLTNAQSDGSGDYFIDSSFSSTVFAVGDDIYGPNVSNNNYIAYCFSEVAGYSKFGSYTPNQNDDGPFVYTGFTPQWIMIKSVGNIYGGGSPFSGNWYILDTERSTFNVAAATLAPPSNSAEDTAWGAEGIMDILSNGFKIRTDSLGINATLSGSFIYLAFAESPFKNARAR